MATRPPETLLSRLRPHCPADLSGLHVDEEMHAADAAESRERVKEAATRLRSTHEQAKGQPTEGSSSLQSAAVPDAEIVEIVESADPGSDEATKREERRAQESAEPSETESAEDRVTSAENERNRLEEARTRLRDTAQRLGLHFDSINERCFDEFGMSFQDAGPEQLAELTEALADAAAPATGRSASDAASRGKNSARSAPAKKGAAKKTVAKKAAARGSRSRGTTAPTTQ